MVKREFLLKLKKKFAGTMHQLSQVVIQLDGELMQLEIQFYHYYVDVMVHCATNMII